MFAALAFAFIAVPICEIALLLRVGAAIGGFETVALVVFMAVVGAALARAQGFAAVRRLQAAMMTGQEIGRSMVEGALVLVAAVLMITPGFLTDTIGLALLVPPVRAVVGRALERRFASRVVTGASGFYTGDFSSRPRRGGDSDSDPPPPGVIDV